MGIARRKTCSDHTHPGLKSNKGRFTVGDSLANEVVSCLKRVGAESRERKGGVSGITVEPNARDLVNDLGGHPHAFVLACIADRQTKADIAWSLPHAIRKVVGDFEFDTLRQLPKRKWAEVLGSSRHRLATDMGKLLPAAVRHIEDRYGGDASRIWDDGSSGAAVARRFLAFDGVGPKIANMAVNILIRDFDVALATPNARHCRRYPRPAGVRATGPSWEARTQRPALDP